MVGKERQSLGAAVFLSIWLAGPVVGGGHPARLSGSFSALGDMERGGQDVHPPGSFGDAKTWFQTNVAYDPRIAIATDAVVVHRHGDKLESLANTIGSWKARGYLVGRMFFADSDGQRQYWEGKWDGRPHEDEVERNAKGEVVLCAGIRPYMLPTEGWIRHLEEMTRISIQAGADAILPEEPLAHTFTGYEEAFKPLFEKRYGMPWQPQSASPEAHFLTCQLKAELYLQLEQRLARVTKAEAKRAGRQIAFLMPVHGLYSNRASQLVAPMGTSAGMEGLDGYVGQVWTGPVNWCLAHYSSPDKSFFTSAYALYDYFSALVAGTGKTMWLLADPVEDDPDHKWADYEEWYRHCLAAKLMFRDIGTYEVMPWPDRIFLPGYQTGGGTPAPENYRISLLSALEVMQEIPATPTDRTAWAAGFKIGVAVADSALWEPGKFPLLDGLYGLVLPLLKEGMWATVSLAERWTEPGYLGRFRVLVVSYENFKPTRPEQNVALINWVRKGGVLVLLGGAGTMKGDAFWWTRLKQASARDHLLSLAGIDGRGDGEQLVDKGWILWREVSPRGFADPDQALEYGDLLADAVDRAEPGAILKAPGFTRGRGRFFIAHALARLIIPGPVVDVLDPDLPLLDEINLKSGQSGIYRQVEAELARSSPCVLHCTHRLMEQEHKGKRSRIVIRGPAGTPAVIRLYSAGREVKSVSVRSAAGEVRADIRPDEENPTMLIRFGNVPEGAVVEIRWR